MKSQAVELLPANEKGDGYDEYFVLVIRTVEQARNLLVRARMVSRLYAESCGFDECVKILTCPQLGKFTGR